MGKRDNWILLILVIVFAFCMWVLIPIDGSRFGRKGIQYGIDLQGGVRLVYQADLSQVPESNQKEMMQGVTAVLANRINPLGVTEPNIELRGANQIVVEIPKLTVSDIQKDRIGRTALLEFREQEDIKDADGNVTGQKWVPATAVINGETKTLNSSYFKDNTYVTRSNTNGAILLIFEWTTEGAQISKEVTIRLLNKPLGIFEGSGEDAQPLLGDDGQAIAPVVNAVITDNGEITGLSLAEATDLSKQLNAGRLPVPLKLIGEMNVDPTLGADFVRLAIQAGIIGIAAVMIFMIAYYRIPGVVACISLIYYGVITLALFKLWPVTMTLAGIGGFVLSIGMAVDANVLIFERMKEELKAGQTLGSAIESGFSRAWSAIWDSNITTIIACVVLYWVGSTAAFGGSVKGFALTLGIGVVISMLTAVLLSRLLMRPLTRTGLAQNTALFRPYAGRNK
jgi:preprotein translocase subunit SecD